MECWEPHKQTIAPLLQDSITPLLDHMEGIMLTDSFGREITYLRVSITDRCNYRCTYCMPEQGVELKPHSDMLSYEQFIAIVREAAALGVRKVRITGGEPLIKRNVEFLVQEISSIPGIEETCMTTNGSLLTDEKAVALKRAGLSRINISLDTLDAQKFSDITRGGKHEDALRGVDAALKAKLNPVKINMLVFDDTTEDEIQEMRDFCGQRGAVLQTIRHFSLHDRKNSFHPTTNRPPKCEHCNRIRLTADGFLKPCLFADKELRVDFNDIRGSLLDAVRHKPENGQSCSNRTMSQIGG